MIILAAPGGKDHAAWGLGGEERGLSLAPVGFSQHFGLSGIDGAEPARLGVSALACLPSADMPDVLDRWQAKAVVCLPNRRAG